MSRARIGTAIGEAVRWLKAGELVAIPTETVYGLAGNALQADAVARIFEVKNRPSFDPLIVHTDSAEKVPALVSSFPEQARRLLKIFAPGPLTLLLPRSALIPDLVTAGSPRVAIRIPNHPVVLELLHQLDFPLAAPSANPFGYISPTSAEHVMDQLGDRIPYILDGGPCEVGVESTIIGWEGEDAIPTIWRKGGIPVEDIIDVLGPVVLKSESTSNPQAPGTLKSHYAPRKPLVLGALDQLLEQYAEQHPALLLFGEPFRQEVPAGHQFQLSSKGDIGEAAQRLFAGLRILDGLPEAEVILASPLPEKGLGMAINDRLRRASYRGA